MYWVCTNTHLSWQWEQSNNQDRHHPAFGVVSLVENLDRKQGMQIKRGECFHEESTEYLAPRPCTLKKALAATELRLPQKLGVKGSCLEQAGEHLCPHFQRKPWEPTSFLIFANPKAKLLLIVVFTAVHRVFSGFWLLFYCPLRA